MRFFLGVGKYTPNDAVSGEMAWKSTVVRHWKCVRLYWSKLAAMNNNRLNKRISLWAFEKAGRSCKNWMHSVSQFLAANNFGQFSCITEAILSSRRFVTDFENNIYENFVTGWSSRINSNVGPSGRGRNKLCLYKTFKQNYIAENYYKHILPVSHRFRCGVAPIRIKIGRYEGLAEESRLCPFCNVLENEIHEILNCKVYDDLRDALLAQAINFDPNFDPLSLENKFEFLFSSQDLARLCAKTCSNILQRRQTLNCK